MTNHTKCMSDRSEPGMAVPLALVGKPQCFDKLIFEGTFKNKNVSLFGYIKRAPVGHNP